MGFSYPPISLSSESVSVSEGHTSTREKQDRIKKTRQGVEVHEISLDFYRFSAVITFVFERMPCNNAPTAAHGGSQRNTGGGICWSLLLNALDWMCMDACVLRAAAAE